MLSVTTEHALRALVCLAQIPYGEQMLRRDISEKADVPLNYLTKILNDMRRANILDATRGTGGGYMLKKRADEIRLIEVLELFEGDRAHLGCLLGNKGDCSDDNACSAHATWKHVKIAYLNFMEQTTIAVIAGCEVPGQVELSHNE